MPNKISEITVCPPVLKIYMSITCHSLILLLPPLPPWKRIWPLISTLNFLNPRILFSQVWLKLSEWFLSRRFLRLLKSLCGYYPVISPWKNMWPFICTNLNTLYPRIFCVMFGWFWWRRFLKVISIFSLCCYFPLTFIWRKLNPLYQRMFCAKFGWIWPDGSGEGVVNVFSLCSNYTCISLWQKAWPFIWINLNRLQQGMLYVKYGGTWLSDSEEVNTDMWKDMDLGSYIIKQRYTIQLLLGPNVLIWV